MQALERLADFLQTQQAMLCCAESCTGGLVAKLCTDMPGSSNWFDRGFVTYSNQAKQDMLGVSEQVLATYGAVSQQTVEAMACGALRYSQADYALAISGIAGPGGGSAEKPVGTVWFGFATADKSYSVSQSLKGDRAMVRQQSARFALETLWAFCGEGR